jgi:hypothetical protein
MNSVLQDVPLITYTNVGHRIIEIYFYQRKLSGSAIILTTRSLSSRQRRDIIRFPNSYRNRKISEYPHAIINDNLTHINYIDYIAKKE